MVVSAAFNSPGPKYGLPTATGFDGHDPTLRRAPALSIATARKDKMKPKAPGPKYDCSGMSRKGKFTSREAYLEGKPNYKYPRTPGTLNYEAHLVPDLYHDRPPAWYFGAKPDTDYRGSSPAPKYLVPPTVGVAVPDIPNSPAYTILGRNAIKLPKTDSPGPGRYPKVENEVNLPRAPTPQIIGKPKISTRYTQTVPAPKYKTDFNEKKEAPSYSFGVKHSMYQSMVYTQADRQPFYGF